MFDSLIDFSRYALPILALFILGFCLGALLRRRPQSLGPVQIINSSTGDCFPISTRETSIGSHKNCDIVIDSSGVQKQHAVITCNKDGWYISCISSAVIKVNGNPIEKKQLLTTGCKIEIGQAKLIFENRFIKK